MDIMSFDIWGDTNLTNGGLKVPINTAKKKALKYIEDTFTHEQIDRILDLACRRLKDNYGQEAPIDKNEKKLWFELFYKWCAGYNGKKLRDM